MKEKKKKIFLDVSILNMDGKPDSVGDVFNKDTVVKWAKDCIHVSEGFSFMGNSILERAQSIVGKATIKKEAECLKADIELIDRKRLPKKKP